MIRFSSVRRAVPRRVEPDGELAKERKQIVATERWVRRVEEWCKRQAGQAPSFSEAVRVLVDRAIDDEERRNGKR